VAEVVLDASAVLAHLQQERGWETVSALILAGGAAIGAVNLSEVVGRLADGGSSDREIRQKMEEMGLEVAPFDADLAFAAGLLRPATRRAGLSLGDRACLSLATKLGVPAITADRSWSGLRLPVRVEVIR
jgi:PIN domain nuclease of toxin-antitoxin system